MPDPVSTLSWYKVVELVSNGTWDMATAVRLSGMSAEAIGAQLAKTAADKAGKQVMSGMAEKALERWVGQNVARTMIAEAGAELAAAGGAAELGVGAAGATEAVGLGLLGWTAVVGVVLFGGYGIYKYMHRNDAPPAVRLPAVAAGPNAPAEQSADTCTRGDAVLTERGRDISVEGNAVSYTDRSTGDTNTIQWNAPPPSITSGQEVTLSSWSTHNQGAPVEVRWETGNWRDHGADSLINEGNKLSKFKLSGGRLSYIELIGGVRESRSGGPGHFVMRWPYTCR